VQVGDDLLDDVLQTSKVLHYLVLYRVLGVRYDIEQLQTSKALHYLVLGTLTTRMFSTN
jgi:hypothetical protein